MFFFEIDLEYVVILWWLLFVFYNLYGVLLILFYSLYLKCLFKKLIKLIFILNMCKKVYVIKLCLMYLLFLRFISLIVY